MQMVYVMCYIIPHQDEHSKNKQKHELKSTGMKTCLTPFCTVKQNPLPLACLGVEGEESTKKPCNYYVLAQQQRAKSIKDFPLSKPGLPQRKSQAVWIPWTFGFSPETHKAKRVCQYQYYSCTPYHSMDIFFSTITIYCRVHHQYFKKQFTRF